MEEASSKQVVIDTGEIKGRIGSIDACFNWTAMFRRPDFLNRLEVIAVPRGLENQY